MHIRVDRQIAFAVLDTLLERWKTKKFPYNQPDAILPQTIIPKELRRRRKDLALFYFYICIYMRGGIESLQVFRAFARMRTERPELFKPEHAELLMPGYVEEVLRRYIGWDAKRAGINWVENSRRLMAHWGGDPLNAFAGLHTWEEALRRFRNKTTKREKLAAGPDGGGFFGHQPKMVSMQLYFADWEGWLTPRFLYPSPADFHNFRLGLNQGAIVVSEGTGIIRTTEKLAAPWREAVMAYLVEHGADPVELSDALWLFSLVMCGNSPLTISMEKKGGSGLFDEGDVPHRLTEETFRLPRYRGALERTCLRCPLGETCTLAIPSAPYYRKGQLVLRQRPRMERAYGRILPDTPVRAHGQIAVASIGLFGPDG